MPFGSTPVTASQFQSSSYAEQGVEPTVHEYVACNGQQCEFVEEILFSSAHHRFSGEKSRNTVKGNTSLANKVKKTQSGARGLVVSPQTPSSQNADRCMQKGQAALSPLGQNEICQQANPGSTSFNIPCSS